MKLEVFHVKRFSDSPWGRWAMCWGAPSASVALGTVALATAVQVRSVGATAVVIVVSLVALFAFVLSMPRSGRG
ncbi:hypothetical protein SMD44_p10278 (plasmid) [Streptomyces alboflavus]|uniref:Uncharacterized protein n=1 Tax=Streptomyces alboflavus TaxID=67267 RepID=A0A291W4D0_9ACTN|nr:hypothetical protein SMD44_p10278 [Streptomyces alboflavus]